jgi:hypothetical protein
VVCGRCRMQTCGCPPCCDYRCYRRQTGIGSEAGRTVNVTRENLIDVQKELGMSEGFDVGREMYETRYKMSVMIDSGLDISPVITHRLDSRCHRRLKTGF